MQSDEERYNMRPPVAKVVPMEKEYKRNDDFSIPIAIAIFVTACFCPAFGLVAIILACMAKSNKNNVAESERLRRCSFYLSLAGFLCGVLVFAAALMVAFAYKGSDIYIKKPGEPTGKIYWQSNA